jgi:hypothetical protein
MAMQPPPYTPGAAAIHRTSLTNPDKAAQARKAAVTFMRNQFTKEAGPSNPVTAKERVETAIHKTEPGFHVAGWRQSATNDNLFVPVDDKGERHHNYVYCTLCDKGDGAAIASSGNSGNINGHMWDQHHIPKPNAKHAFLHGGPIEKTWSDPEVRSALVVFWMVQRAQPFVTVDHPVFRFLTRTRMERHDIPSRIKQTAKKVSDAIKVLLGKCNWVAACFDEWTSSARQSFLAINVQATDGTKVHNFCLGHVLIRPGEADSGALGSIVKRKLEEFGVWDKVNCFVTDNASVCIRICKDLQKKRSPCIAHVLNLMLGDFVNAFKEDLQPLITLAAKSRRSPKFRDICMRDKMARTSLTTYTTTRFYSLNQLLTGAIELEEQVLKFADFIYNKNRGKKVDKTLQAEVTEQMRAFTIAPSEDPLAWLDGEDEAGGFIDPLRKRAVPTRLEIEDAITVARRLAPVIEAFGDGTGAIEGDEFGTRASAFMVKWMIEQKVKATNDPAIIRVWEAAAMAHWKKHTEDAELDFAVVTVLRRSINARLILGDTLYEAAIAELTRELAQRGGGKVVPVTQLNVGTTQASPATKKRVVEDEMEQMMATAARARTQESEMTQFLAMSALLKDDSDLLTWWSGKRMILPGLWGIAMEKCIVPATSAASERQFSAAKRVLTDMRRSMTAETHGASVFCCENLSMVAEVLGIDINAIEQYVRETMW